MRTLIPAVDRRTSRGMTGVNMYRVLHVPREVALVAAIIVKVTNNEKPLFRDGGAMPMLRQGDTIYDDNGRRVMYSAEMLKGYINEAIDNTLTSTALYRRDPMLYHDEAPLLDTMDLRYFEKHFRFGTVVSDVATMLTLAIASDYAYETYPYTSTVGRLFGEHGTTYEDESMLDTYLTKMLGSHGNTRRITETLVNSKGIPAQIDELMLPNQYATLLVDHQLYSVVIGVGEDGRLLQLLGAYESTNMQHIIDDVHKKVGILVTADEITELANAHDLCGPDGEFMLDRLLDLLDVIERL